jgi:DNA-binding PadR family transcriptional regulator
MTTRYAVLGLLSFEPMSGYDIRRASTDALSHFWHESYGQIYPTLAALEREKLIRLLPKAEDSARARKVYALTPKGRRALAAWHKKPPVARPFRNELLLKLFTAERPSDMRAHLERLREEESARLVEYAKIEQRIAREAPTRASWKATVRYGIHRSRAVIAWCDETLK